MDLINRFQQIRRWTTTFCEPLEVEDQVIQSMPDVSPTRWHLAHTTWFFETFLLKAFVPGYQSQFEQFEYLFNSYYNTVGRQFPRHQRGHLSRPTLAEILSYRRTIDELIVNLLGSPAAEGHQIQRLLEIGLQHEQQHQELMVTDIKHVLSCNPLYPSYHWSGVCPWLSSAERKAPVTGPVDSGWTSHPGGIVSIGARGDEFAFDNEFPRHQTLLSPFQLANRPVTNREYLAFIEDGGYQRPDPWLALGWSTVQEHHWQHPLYWRQHNREWREFTLWGLQPLDWEAPVSHISFFEADAFARWAGARLPSESEWETVASAHRREGNFADSGVFQPLRCAQGDSLRQCFGDVWEWTSSAYLGYPGYHAPTGAIGEYNGKFMCNQFVLRGGSCATASSHIRASYRNFFPPEARWQFSGMRLANSE